MIKTPKDFEIKFLDASRLSCISRCEAKFFFKYIMGLSPPKDPTKLSGNLPLDYGTIMHRVLPHMYDGTVERSFEEFDNLWERYGYGEENPARNTSITKRRIINFIMNHKPGVCPYKIQHFKFSTVSELVSPNEVPFLIDIGAIYPLAGRIDAVVSLESTKALWAFDFKTASEVSERYFNGFWHAPQPCTYTIALQQMTGEPIEGLLIEAMRISAAKTQEEGKHIESQFFPVYVTQHNINNFLTETKLTCARIEAANSFGTWRQNFACCSTYSCFGFPSGTCEYKLLCDGSDWQENARFYEQKTPFNPLDNEED